MYFFDLHCDTITRLNTGERLEPGDDFLKSLVPGDGFKLPLAPRSHPAQGREDPVLPVHILPPGQSFGAQQAVAGGVAPGALDFQYFSVFDIAGHPAVGPRGADVAEAVAGGDAGVRAGNFVKDFFLCRSHGELRSFP